MQSPWTYEELERMKADLSGALDQTEKDHPNIRPLPPLSEEDVLGLIHALIGTAHTRPLTEDEVFLHGQLLSCFRMAVQASMLLGHPGRYYVVSKDDVERLARKV